MLLEAGRGYERGRRSTGAAQCHAKDPAAAKGGARKVHGGVVRKMSEPPARKSATSVTTTSGPALPAAVEELPVVARLIIEVRSDGSRTVARGAMEDAASDTRVAIEASGTSPLELALGLAKSILAAPWLRRQMARGGLRALLRKPRP